MKDAQYIIISFTINSSSLSEFFIGLVKRLSQNYSVLIITKRKANLYLGFNTNVEVLYWPSKRPTGFKDAKFLYSQIKKYQPVMAISLFGSVNLITLVGWLTKVPLRIVWVRTLSSQYHNKKWLMERKKLIYKLASHIFVNSEATNRDVEDVYKISSSKIKVLPNSIKPYPKTIEKNKTSVKEISYAGRLHASKGIDTLLKAFKNCLTIDKTLHLNIIGDGEEKTKLENLVDQLNLNDSVVFHGFQSKSNVLEIFKNSYMVVVPSITEAFGFVTIEAMSVKTAVIGSDTSGIAEIIRNEQDGLLFEPQNDTDLFQQMKRLLLDENFTIELAENGYQRFMSTYEHQNAIERDFKVLDQYIKNIE
ncbi:glycosyltransferase family 4 protein [Mesonia mobilis]|uniref:glycosyltransferase family 4 protein n=1 Tax=Mesonia mobilis TaxID=369791 RepID=UPI0026F06A63|nr:glycosyltransferase family 4 protein [Mesonia mobilis]